MIPLYIPDHILSNKRIKRSKPKRTKDLCTFAMYFDYILIIFGLKRFQFINGEYKNTGNLSKLWGFFIIISVGIWTTLKIAKRIKKNADAFGFLGSLMDSGLIFIITLTAALWIFTSMFHFSTVFIDFHTNVYRICQIMGRESEDICKKSRNFIFILSLNYLILLFIVIYCDSLYWDLKKLSIHWYLIRILVHVMLFEFSFYAFAMTNFLSLISKGLKSLSIPWVFHETYTNSTHAEDKLTLSMRAFEYVADNIEILKRVFGLNVNILIKMYSFTY